MIRALATLLGFAAAAVLLALAPDAGDLTGDTLWYIAGVWAAAGLVAGILYQAGGVRRPGTRLNQPMLFLAWLPWSLLAAGAVVQLAEPGGDVARLYRDVLPDTWLAHWTIAMSVLCFGSGLLLAFTLIEPRVAVNRIVTVAEEDERPVAVEPRPEPVAVQPRPEPVAVEPDATDLDEQPLPAEPPDRDAEAREAAARDEARMARTTRSD
jgi:hypothetical protein